MASFRSALYETDAAAVPPMIAIAAARARESLLWWCALALVLAVLGLPLGLVQAPPLLDYLNHLARTYVLAVGANDPALSQMYAPRWAIIPNLAIDILLPPLIQAMPVFLAGKIVVFAAIVLPLLGTVAYSRATFRERSYWPLGACLVAYNATLLLGFLNFQIGLGLALLLAAVWLRWRDARPATTLLICATGAVGLFFCHLMALALFLVLIGARELESIWRAPAEALARLPRLVAVAVIPCVLYLLAPFRDATGTTLFLSAPDKAAQLLLPFVAYDPLIDSLVAILVVSGVIGLLLGARMRLPPHGLIAIGALFALYIAAPMSTKGTCFLDTRFAIMLGYLVFATLLPTRLPRRLGAGIGAVGAALFLWRMASICAIWQGHQRDLDALRAVIEQVRPGEKVFVTTVAPEEAPEYWRTGPRSRWLSNGVRVDYHMPALLVLEHSAFWPYLFADPAQQPIAVLPPYRRLADTAGPLPAHWLLDAPNNRILCDYDFVLLLGAGGEPDVAHFGGGRLGLLRANSVAALYRVQQADDPALCHARSRPDAAS
jgi:hypothetical protein